MTSLLPCLELPVASNQRLSADDDLKKNIIKGEGRLGYQTGELCFISHVKYDCRIQCDNTVTGHQLTMNSADSDSNAWEVWRFIEESDGSVQITSWLHHQKVLCSDRTGRVFTTEKKKNVLSGSSSWEKWAVRKSNGGVIIQSIAHFGRVLAFDGKSLCTIGTTSFHHVDNMGIIKWQFEAAHRQQYFLTWSSKHQDHPRIGTDGTTVTIRTSKNGTFGGAVESGSKWKIIPLVENNFNNFNNSKEQEEDSLLLVSLQTTADHHGAKFLTCDESGCLSVVSELGSDGHWIIKPSPHGGVFLLSYPHNRLLAYNPDGQVVGRVYDHHQPEWYDDTTTLFLEFAMPEKTTIGRPAVETWKKTGVVLGSALLVGVAAPYAVMATVTGLGFTSRGIVAGSTAAGMMSAEAIATGGGVAAGGTVATLQSIGAVGLGASRTLAAASCGAILGGATSSLITTLIEQGMKRGGGTAEAMMMHHDNDGTSAASNRRLFCAWQSWY